MDELIVTEATATGGPVAAVIETLESKVKNMDQQGLAALKISELSLGELNAYILRKEELHKLGQRKLKALAAAMGANP